MDFLIVCALPILCHSLFEVVIRIAAELPLEDRVELPAMIKGDMLLFTELVQGDPLDLKTLGLPNVKLRDLIELLKTIYC